MRENLKSYADLILDADTNDPVQGILLLASEGRGKRFLCRCLADQLTQERGQKFNFISRDIGEAHNLYQARQIIRRSLKVCVKHAPTVLLLQNFDTFYRYLEQNEQLGFSNTGQTTWWNRLMGKLGFADLASEAEKARKLRKQLDTDLETYWQWNQQKKRPIIIIAAVKNLEILPLEVHDWMFSQVQPIPKPDLLGRVAILEKMPLSDGNSPTANGGFNGSGSKARSG